MPAMIVKQGVVAQFDILQSGEKFEKRIARHGYEDFVARIAEEAKDERISFAGAGGEKDVVTADRGTSGQVLYVVSGNRLTRSDESLGVGSIVEGAAIRDSGQNLGAGVGEANARRIRFGKIEQFPSRTAVLLNGASEGSRREVPTSAARKHDSKL